MRMLGKEPTGRPGCLSARHHNPWTPPFSVSCSWSRTFTSPSASCVTRRTLCPSTPSTHVQPPSARPRRTGSARRPKALLAAQAMAHKLPAQPLKVPGQPQVLAPALVLVLVLVRLLGLLRELVVQAWSPRRLLQLAPPPPPPSLWR